MSVTPTSACGFKLTTSLSPLLVFFRFGYEPLQTGGVQADSSWKTAGQFGLSGSSCSGSTLVLDIVGCRSVALLGPFSCLILTE